MLLPSQAALVNQSEKLALIPAKMAMQAPSPIESATWVLDLAVWVIRISMAEGLACEDEVRVLAHAAARLAAAEVCVCVLEDLMSPAAAATLELATELLSGRCSGILVTVCQCV